MRNEWALFARTMIESPGPFIPLSSGIILHAKNMNVIIRFIYIYNNRIINLILICNLNYSFIYYFNINRNEIIKCM